MKKITLVVLALTLCLMMFANAVAEGATPYAGSGNKVFATLTLNSSSGTASARVTLLAGYSASSTIYVQKLVNGSWVTVKTATGTTRVSTSFSASTGVSYRVYAVSTAIYDATGETERLTAYSETRSN